MWQKLDRSFNGAEEIAAPLFVPEVRLRHRWHGALIEKVLSGKIDTAASMTAIPKRLALEMQLPSRGKKDGFKSFDHSLELPPYPLFSAELFTPQSGWQIMTVVACERDTVLLGRDICNKMLLMVNWQRRGFGMRPAHLLHCPLRFLFSRLRKKKP